MIGIDNPKIRREVIAASCSHSMRMHGGTQTSSGWRRRLNSGAASPRLLHDTSATVTVAGLLGVLMGAGLVLLVLSGYMTPVLAQQRDHPEPDLFPANLMLEVTDEHISADGRQVVVPPLSPSRETFDDLLFIERAGQSELRPRQMENRDRPKTAAPSTQSWMDRSQQKKLNR